MIPTMLDLRPSSIAGTWYEGDREQLARQVDGFLESAELPDLNGRVLAVIAPHAGHRYSGAVAGHAFAALRGSRARLAAVVSPMHHPYPQPLITTAHAAYCTPLGEIAVDAGAVDRLDRALQAARGSGLARLARDPEHSLEIELPFLQRVLPAGFTLLPVMVRAQDPALSQALGEALADVLRETDCVLVGSTDLSHFFDQATAQRLDGAMLAQIESFSPEGAFEAERAGRGFACGLGAFTAVLWAARALGADTVRIVRHATSGDVTGDYTSVVGYGAAVVLKSGS
jgi:AmmeMemoRadiSam system protein B